ncbi:hypothetical protein DFS33DRAFT_1355213 [Desarmillaria ectypa]|nr:hypothetical protein DFS33DRAFT_1355213 [Desarmillaria ectypa]
MKLVHTSTVVQYIPPTRRIKLLDTAATQKELWGNVVLVDSQKKPWSAPTGPKYYSTFPDIIAMSRLVRHTEKQTRIYNMVMQHKGSRSPYVLHMQAINEATWRAQLDAFVIHVVCGKNIRVNDVGRNEEKKDGADIDIEDARSYHSDHEHSDSGQSPIVDPMDHEGNDSNSDIDMDGGSDTDPTYVYASPDEEVPEKVPRWRQAAADDNGHVRHDV